MTNMIEIDGIQIPESKILELGYAKDKVDKVFMPELNERYFIVSTEAAVEECKWTDHWADLGRLSLGNCFRSVGDAEQSLCRSKATVRVLNKLRELEGDWVADWASKQVKWICCYVHSSTKFIVVDYSDLQIGRADWYSTKEAWEHVIENMESDVKLMMGVGDD